MADGTVQHSLPTKSNTSNGGPRPRQRRSAFTGAVTVWVIDDRRVATSPGTASRFLGPVNSDLRSWRGRAHAGGLSSLIPHNNSLCTLIKQQITESHGSICCRDAPKMERLPEGENETIAPAHRTRWNWKVNTNPIYILLSCIFCSVKSHGSSRPLLLTERKR